jgi:hypothetical protein
MERPDSLAWTSLALAAVIAICALLLGVRLWWERRTREGGLTDLDRRHFLLQDLRRAVGILFMAYLALGIYVGSRLPTFVMEPKEPREFGPVEFTAGAAMVPALEAHPNRQFLVIWLAVFASVVLLLGLAMIDWISTRRYADRQRRMMNQERLEILRETIRQSQPTEDGRANDQPTAPA